MQRSVKFNAVMNTMLTASTMLVNIVTIPYVTRVLSVEGYGNVNFAQSLSTWLSALCLVGIPTYGVRECARVRDDPEALARIVRELLIIITVFTVAVLGVFALCIITVPRLVSLAPLMWLFLMSTLLLSYGVEWYFQSREEYEYITARSVIFKFLSFLAILLFVRHANDWLIYGAILALVTCGNNLFNIVRLLHDVPMRNIGTVNLHRHVKPLASYAVLSIASSIYLSFDSVLLGLLNANNVQVALYQLAAKLKGICWSVINAIIGVLIPRLSYYAKKDSKKYDDLLKRGFGFLNNLCLGIMAYLFVFAQPLVVLISSNKYSAAVVPVQIIGVVNFLSCMSYFFGLCILSPLGRERKLAEANLLGVPISLFMNIGLDGYLGAIGAALSVLAAEASIFAKQAYDSRKELKRIVDVRMIARTVASHLAAFVAALMVKDAMRYTGINFLTTNGAAVAAVIGFIAYSFVWLISALVLHEECAIWSIGLIKRK